MAYIENPIVEGKDFKSVRDDVNGNFEEIKKYLSTEIGIWEKIGEVRITGLPPTSVGGYSNTTSSLGSLCGTIDCHGEQYEKLYLAVEGTLPSVTKLKTAMQTSYEGNSYYPDFISNSAYFNRGGNTFVKLWNAGYYDLPSANIQNQFNFYWLYGKNVSPDEVDITVKLYGLRKSQWLLDALEIT